ncbi:hypothetical protein mRhiFer1_009531 [Rhinolophus ferrumequinum]|uniref:Uncharacterized protein n=1 Tax=Rhinolophus ferrumequinum TaxID=59479 RepID=A0A7J7RB34_RHIFE|nr:hypothetical protein mRhiFer1_009531 [Rhinolophus ferrumequinum]
MTVSRVQTPSRSPCYTLIHKTFFLNIREGLIWFSRLEFHSLRFPLSTHPETQWTLLSDQISDRERSQVSEGCGVTGGTVQLPWRLKPADTCRMRHRPHGRRQNKTSPRSRCPEACCLRSHQGLHRVS